MSRVANPTVLRTVGFLMIVIAILNVAPVGVFMAGGGPDLVAGEQVEPFVTNPINEFMLAVGGVTSPMGIMTIIHAPVMAAVGVALLMLKRWEMFAAVMIGIDILVKIGVILSLAAVGRGYAILVPLAFIIVEAVLTVVTLQQWNARKRMEREDAAPAGVHRPV